MYFPRISYLPRIRRPSEPENSRDFFAKYCDSSRTGLSISILFPNIFDVNYVGARVKLALETCTVGKRHCKHADCRVAHCGLPQPEYWNKHCLKAQQSAWLGIFVKPWTFGYFLPFLSKEICSTFSHRGCFPHCVSEANYGPIEASTLPKNTKYNL